MNNDMGNAPHNGPQQPPHGMPAQSPQSPYPPHQSYGPPSHGFGGPMQQQPMHPGPGGPTQQQPMYPGPGGPGQPFMNGPGLPPKGPDRPWFQKKRWWAAGVVGLFVVVGAVGGGAAEDETTTASDSAASATQQSENRSGTNKRKRAQRDSTQEVEAADDEVQEVEEAEPVTEPEPAPEPSAMQVDASTLLEAFEGNEAAADAEYSGKTLEVSGNVYKVDTEFLDEDQYVVMLDNGEAFSFLTVNCNDVTADQAAGVQTGSTITVRGQFDDGGDLGVELSGCEVL